jgi:proteasome accessory factor A
MLMGLETEYAICGRRGDALLLPERLAQWICQAARQVLCCLPDMGSPSGVFVENGGRLYADINGHPEYATPECTSPGQVVLFDLAGEQMLLRLAVQMLREQRLTEVHVGKHNLCGVNPQSATWGNHESYTAWVPPAMAAEALISFLVTRLPYSGAGCLSADPRGDGFEWSGRARHLVQDVGGNTTAERPIFCMRIRKTTDASPEGWTRIHLIGKDSQRGALGTYLTVGVTGLLVWILNHGGEIGRRLKLANSVQSLRAVSLDFGLQTRLQLADGRRLSALEIQEQYLVDCEAFGRTRELPEWAGAVLGLWRRTLATLARDPLSLAGELDSATKRLLFQHVLQRGGANWRALQRGLALVARLRQVAQEGVMQAIVEENARRLPFASRPALTAAHKLVQADGSGALDRLRLALRLQALDVKYHELGGLYEQLAAAQPPRILRTPRSLVEVAATTPPPGGRAALRAAQIKAHHRHDGWAANWQSVVNLNDRTTLDLRNPFASAATTIASAEFETADHPPSLDAVRFARRAVQNALERETVDSELLME